MKSPPGDTERVCAPALYVFTVSVIADPSGTYSIVGISPLP